jgi:hypothetical protein
MLVFEHYKLSSDVLFRNKLPNISSLVIAYEPLRLSAILVRDGFR